MATDDDRPYRINQQRTSNGHNIYCLISVHSLGSVQTWPVVKKFNSDCHSYPTTWTLGIVYQQCQDTAKFNCIVNLKRNDSLPILVNVHALVSFVNINGRILRFPQTVFSTSILPSQERQGCITNATLPYSMRPRINRNEDLKVTIFIRSCHSTRNFQPITLMKLKQDESKRLLEMSDEM